VAAKDDPTSPSLDQAMNELIIKFLEVIGETRKTPPMKEKIHNIPKI
jgi:hypothetical protein